MAELSAERRDRILRAMARCVVEEGIQGASLRKVAKRANATTGMITHYYRSKNELIVEALRSAGERLRASQQASGIKPGLQRLLTRFELRIRNKDPEVPSWKYFMEYWAASTRSEELRQHHVELSHTGRARILEDIEHAIKDGAADPDINPADMADLMHALYYGLGVLSTLDPDSFSDERTYSLVKAAVARLLKSRQEL